MIIFAFASYIFTTSNDQYTFKVSWWFRWMEHETPEKRPEFPWAKFITFNQVTMNWVCSSLPELQHCWYNQILKTSFSSQSCSSGNQGQECSHGMQNSHKWVKNSDILTMPSRNSILNSKSSFAYIFSSFRHSVCRNTNPTGSEK